MAKAKRITEELVRAVGAKVAKGLTVAQALLVVVPEEQEPIPPKAFFSVVNDPKNPLARLYARVMAQRLDAYTDRLESEPMKSVGGLAWLLERRHADQFARPAQEKKAGPVLLTMHPEDRKRLDQVAVENLNGNQVNPADAERIKRKASGKPLVIDVSG